MPPLTKPGWAISHPAHPPLTIDLLFLQCGLELTFGEFHNEALALPEMGHNALVELTTFNILQESKIRSASRNLLLELECINNHII